MDFKKDEAYYYEAKEVMEKGFLDKRTKDYRTYKEYVAWYEKEGYHKNVGAGDIVEKVAKATGVDKVVKAIAGDDCGCDARKAKLNQMLRVTVFECLVEEDYDYLVNFFQVSRTRVTHEEQSELYRIYNYVFGKNLKPSKCPSCVRQVVNNLKRVLDGQK